MEMRLLNNYNLINISTNFRSSRRQPITRTRWTSRQSNKLKSKIPKESPCNTCYLPHRVASPLPIPIIQKRWLSLGKPRRSPRTKDNSHQSEFSPNDSSSKHHHSSKLQAWDNNNRWAPTTRGSSRSARKPMKMYKLICRKRLKKSRKAPSRASII